jgi:DNA polymerase I
VISTPQNIVSFDCETTGLNPYGDPEVLGFTPARPFLFAFSNIEGESESYRIDIDPFTRKVDWGWNSIAHKNIRYILENPKITKIGHNIGFDFLMCKFMKINYQGDFHETMAIAHILTGGSEMTYALKPLCKKLMGFEDEDEKALKDSVIHARKEAKRKGWKIAEGKIFGRDPIKADYWLGDRALCNKYAIQDTQRAMLLYLGLFPKLQKNIQMLKTYQMEKELMPLVWNMEQRGVRIHPEKVEEITKYYEEHQRKNRILADRVGGRGLNFSSPVQLQKHFFGIKKYQPLKYTKPTKNNPNGNPSTDGDSLVHFCEKYEDKLAKAIIEYNAADQMITAFMDPYRRMMVKNGSQYFLHPNFRQIGPVTGRFSASDPNLQQVASDDSGKKKADIELRPRECFGPRKGYIWYLPDYSQIEIWVFSFISQERSLINMLLSGEDFHAGTAKRVWGEESDFKERTDYYRKRSKYINFGKLFGAGIGQISKLMGVSYEDASIFVYEYDERVPAVSRFMNRISNQMAIEGKIVNPFGRYYFLPSDIAYKATNYIVQGTAADILKRAMIRIGKIKEVQMLLTLHDELVIEVPLEYHSKNLIQKIVSAMQMDSSVIKCPIPLPVGVKISKKYWSQCEELNWVKDEWKAKYICRN